MKRTCQIRESTLAQRISGGIAGRTMRETPARRSDSKRMARRFIFGMLAAGLLSVTLAAAKDAPEGAVSPDIDRVLKSASPSGANGGKQEGQQVAGPRAARTRRGYLRTLGSPPSQHFKPTSVVPGDPQATATNFLAEHGAAFGMKNRAFDLTPGKTRSRAERSHVRFGQAYAGIPVFAAETVVQLDEAGGVQYVSSDIMTDDETPEADDILTAPAVITGADAGFIAIGMLMDGNPGLEFQAKPATLVIYQPAVIGSTGPAHLVWQTTVASVSDSRVAELVLVDAHSGEIALHYPLVSDMLYRRINDAVYSTSVGSSTSRRTEWEPPCEFVPDVDLAYDYAGDAYNFYSAYHGRDGLDGAGLTPPVYVRWGPSDEFDAFWSPDGYLAFGEDCLTDDGVGHEWTHGVIMHESALVYVNESGAINEFFADSWGEWIDQTNGRGDDSSAVKWLVGEDLFPPWSMSDGRPALRNMKDPSEDPYYDPDRKGSGYWQDWTQYASPELDNDWGGVHRNSGVGNKLCYLLTDGATFNGYSLYGMGIGKVAGLFYEAQTDLLTRGADYKDLYFALLQAADNLGWTWAEKQNLEYACRAVEIAVGSSRTISGHVGTLSSWDVPSVGIPGVTVMADPGGYSATTNATGEYSLTVPYGWSGTITPSKANQSFSPPWASFQNLASDVTQDFQTTVPQSMAISGYVTTVSGDGLSGVQISDGSHHTTTDASGYYRLEVPYAFTGKVTPSKSGWLFSPATSIYYVGITSDRTQDFVASRPSPPPVTISGYVRAIVGPPYPMVGVTVRRSDGGGSATTDNRGYYSLTVPYDWSGTITPSTSRPKDVFDPGSQHFSGVISNQKQDFVYVGTKL